MFLSPSTGTHYSLLISVKSSFLWGRLV